MHLIVFVQLGAWGWDSRGHVRTLSLPSEDLADIFDMPVESLAECDGLALTPDDAKALKEVARSSWALPSPESSSR